jgi:hypothetical protein
VPRERRPPSHRTPEPPHIHADSCGSNVCTNAVVARAERRHPALGMQRAPHHCQSLETRTTPTTETNNYMSFCRREGHGHLRPQAPPKAQPPILAQVPVLQDFDQPTGECCGRKARSHRRGNASVYAESLRYQYSGSGVSTWFVQVAPFLMQILGIQMKAAGHSVPIGNSNTSLYPPTGGICRQQSASFGQTPTVRIAAHVVVPI